MFPSATGPIRCLLVEDSPADAELARYALQAAHADFVETLRAIVGFWRGTAELPVALG
jgi:hypothetical protein